MAVRAPSRPAATFTLLPRTWPIAGCDVFGRTRQHQLDVSARGLRELRRNNDFRAAAEFRAEAAAEIVREHAHVFRWEIEAHSEIAVPARHRTVSFERDVGLHCGGVDSFMGDGGLLETVGDTAQGGSLWSVRVAAREDFRRVGLAHCFHFGDEG